MENVQLDGNSPGKQSSWKSERLHWVTLSENKVMFLCFEFLFFFFLLVNVLDQTSYCNLRRRFNINPTPKLSVNKHTCFHFVFRFHCEHCVCVRIWRFLRNRSLRGTSGFFFFCWFNAKFPPNFHHTASATNPKHYVGHVPTLAGMNSGQATGASN